MKTKTIIKLDGYTFTITDLSTEMQGIVNVECCQGEGMISYCLQSKNIDITDLSDLAITPNQKEALINLIQLELRKQYKTI